MSVFQQVISKHYFYIIVNPYDPEPDSVLDDREERALLVTKLRGATTSERYIEGFDNLYKAKHFSTWLEAFNHLQPRERVYRIAANYTVVSRVDISKEETGTIELLSDKVAYFDE